MNFWPKISLFAKTQKIIFCKYFGIQYSKFDELFLFYSFHLDLQFKKSSLKLDYQISKYLQKIIF
jgi:hypothetical protein